MAENEGMEGKDLAAEEKKEFKEQVLEQIKRLKNNEPTMLIGEMEATKFGDQTILKVRGKSIAIVNGNTIQYNLANFEALKRELAEDGQTLDDLGLPDLQEEIDKIQEQTSEQEQLDEEQDREETEQEEDGEEIEEEEKDDEKPELEEDKDEKKEEIARKYNVNARDVVHISKNEKLTENERFHDLVNWVGDRDDVYIVQGENPYTYKILGEKDGEQEEIEAGTNKAIGGQAPDVTIKRVDGEQIREVRPYAMYEIDSRTAIAMVKDEYGQTEAIYCRQQGGNEKEYWGSVIPEASGKNVRQQEPEARDFMDHRYNSGLDLDDKADSLARQGTLEERGLPSKRKGVQVEEIQGNHEQNREVNIEDIVEDLMSKDGIVDKLTVPPGYYENKAQKILKLMEENDNLYYEDAVEQVDKEGEREKGGRSQGEERIDPRR